MVKYYELDLAACVDNRRDGKDNIGHAPAVMYLVASVCKPHSNTTIANECVKTVARNPGKEPQIHPPWYILSAPLRRHK